MELSWPELHAATGKCAVSRRQLSLAPTLLAAERLQPRASPAPVHRPRGAAERSLLLRTGGEAAAGTGGPSPRRWLSLQEQPGSLELRDQIITASVTQSKQEGEAGHSGSSVHLPAWHCWESQGQARGDEEKRGISGTGRKSRARLPTAEMPTRRKGSCSKNRRWRTRTRPRLTAAGLIRRENAPPKVL